MSSPTDSNFGKILKPFLLFILFLVTFYYLGGYLGDPRPSDDMFYIDAAYSLQNGSYVPPSKDAPYHHYLRWPVILPLALFMKAFGVSKSLYLAYGIVHHLLATLFLLLIGKGLGIEPRYAIIGALAVFFAPAEFLPSRILSEGVSVVWFLMSLYLLIIGIKKEALTWISLAGLAGALALDTTQVVFFSLVGVFIWLLSNLFRAEIGQRKTKALILGCYASSIFLGYAAILGAEWYFFGSPFFQVEIIQLWHFRNLENEIGIFDRLAQLVDPRFAFGFIIGVFQQKTFYACSVIVGIFLFVWHRRRPTISPLAPIVIIAFGSIFAFEFLAPIAIKKVYLRFLAIPLVLFAYVFLVSTVEFVGSLERTKKFLYAPLFLLSLCIYQGVNMGDLKNDSTTSLYLKPIRRIYQEHRLREKKGARTCILTSEHGVPGLIHYGLAVKIYTDFDKEIRHKVMPFKREKIARLKCEPYLIVNNSKLRPFLETEGLRLLPDSSFHTVYDTIVMVPERLMSPKELASYRFSS